MKPQRRAEGLVIRELPDELLVYDLERHRAHCLNRCAALVFQRSDGETSVKELAAVLRRELGVAADEKWVGLALEKLRKAHLLADDPKPAGNGARYSRRELLRRAGLASAAALPVVISLLAPTPALAVATCVVGNAGCAGPQPFGTPCHCGNPADCGLNCACDGFGSCKENGGAGPGACPGTC
jgi:hypothetical protein